MTSFSIQERMIFGEGLTGKSAKSTARIGCATKGKSRFSLRSELQSEEPFSG
jgi:hypothetical protein